MRTYKCSSAVLGGAFGVLTMSFCDSGFAKEFLGRQGRQSVSHVYPRMGTSPSKFGLTTFHVLVAHPLN